MGGGRSFGFRVIAGIYAHTPSSAFEHQKASTWQANMNARFAIMSTWTPKVCKIMAFMAIIMGLGLLFYILLGFRYPSCNYPRDLYVLTSGFGATSKRVLFL